MLGLVRDPADLYRLREEQLLELSGFKERMAAKVVASIAGSRQRPFPRVLFALGIPHVGYETADILVRAFPDLERLRAASVDELSGVAGIGPIIGRAIADYFADERNLDLVARLVEAGVQTAVAEGTGAPPDGPLSGLHLRPDGDAAHPVARAGDRSSSRRPGGTSPARSAARPTTCWWERSRGRSWPRRRSWGCPPSTRRGCGGCWRGPRRSGAWDGEASRAGRDGRALSRRS